MPQIKCVRYVPKQVVIDVPDEIHAAMLECWGTDLQELKKAYDWYVNHKLKALRNQTPEQAVAAGQGNEVKNIIGRIQYGVYS
ncbi:MAG: hypothetical protein A2831_03000 [Candidatus Yanofskybacteria bacterium RIFCSPHIGHO2_01_FULL_44_17]|uniref:Antitoxin Xre/MbcA/ParS-like toxin-binding domain-containing protein n=1 Tax=Candidatus Yanofskybacteria bacterium RIFCSPHIGHO2_01_FULL_44_17 TaxID=1802668 RepID=A0A1F8EY87_9BACT|nr:MAG: hypothetical protein A2831_03000 [Candidatus Yanofskybacteria bacterium RIFCSPHIGHO2_01_FULL_44_17]